MSTSSRHALYAIPEVTYGVTPATPAFVAVRHTGTTLGTTKSTHISEELRADRQISDFRHGTKQVGGDLKFELSYGSFDQLLEATLGGTWTVKAAPRTAITISASSVDNSINDSANLLPLLAAGDRVTIAGFTGTAGNNQTGLIVVSSTVSKMVLSGGNALVTDAAGESVTVTTLTYQLKAGTVRRSFSVMRHFSDLQAGDKPFHLYTGVELNTMNLTIPSDGIVNGTFGVMGKTQTLSTTGVAGQTLGSASTTRVMDSFTGTITEGGVSLAIATEITLTLENGLEPRFAIGTDSVIGNGVIGRSNLTGQLTAYFENATMLEKFLNETGSSLLFTIVDRTGNSYRFNIPSIVYNGGQPDTQGQGSITLAIPFQAILDSTTASNIVIDRNPIA
jgi:hypothetical protein